MLFHDLENATRVFQGLVHFGDAVCVILKCPFGFVIRGGFGIKTGEKAVLEFVILANDERGVGVITHVFEEKTLILDNILNHTAENGDIRTGTKRNMLVGTCGSTCETWINMNDLSALGLRFQSPFEGNGMVFGSIAAHYQNTITVL